METPKQFLVRQASLPRTMFSGTPLDPLGQGVSDALGNLAKRLPEGGPAAPTFQGTPKRPDISGVFRSIEASLPTGVPSLSSLVNQAANKVTGAGGGQGERGRMADGAGTPMAIATRGMV